MKFENRKIIYGDKIIIDSATLFVDGSDPIKLSYFQGTQSEINLIFNFNVHESTAKTDELEAKFEVLESAASLQLDAVKGKSWRMRRAESFAESNDEVLSVYLIVKTTLKGAIDLSYTIFSQKIGENKNSTPSEWDIDKPIMDSNK